MGNWILESYFPEEEMTLFEFMAHMQGFIKQLLTTPTEADVDNYLKKWGITKKKALDLLLKRIDPNDENSAVLICKRSIKPQEMSEEDKAAGKTPKDNFVISYKLPRENYKKKMRKFYIENFDSNIIDNCPINEGVFANEDNIVKNIMEMDKDNAYRNRGGLNVKPGCLKEEGGGATAAGAVGEAPIQPLEQPIRRRIVQITEDQLKYIQEATAGDIGQGYPAPLKVKKNDPSMNHKDIFKGGQRG